jgi:hypothetical protein
MLHYGDIVITGSGGTHEEFHDIQSPLTFRRAVQTVTDAQIASPPPIREPENVQRQPRAA